MLGRSMSGVHQPGRDGGSLSGLFFFPGRARGHSLARVTALVPLRLNPFRAPEPLPIQNPSNFVPKNGFPVVKGLNLPLAVFILAI